MTALTYAMCCGLFYGAFIALKLVPRTLEFGTIFNEALSVMSDKTLTDDEKEPLVRRAAFAAARKSALLIGGLLIVGLVSVLPLVLASTLQLVSLDAFWEFTLTPLVMIATLVAMVAVELMRRRLYG